MSNGYLQVTLTALVLLIVSELAAPEGHLGRVEQRLGEAIGLDGDSKDGADDQSTTDDATSSEDTFEEEDDDVDDDDD